jgi:hypothetical protein
MTIIFDGDCLFCQRSVRFIHRHDAANRFRFASRQSAAGTRLLAEARVGLAPNSMVLLDEGGVWLRSDAVLRIAGHLVWRCGFRACCATGRTASWPPSGTGFRAICRRVSCPMRRSARRSWSRIAATRPDPAAGAWET